MNPAQVRPFRVNPSTGVRRRRGLLLGAIVATTLMFSGCGVLPGLTVEQIPLPAPGGIGDSYSVNARFDNALNLPARAKVKLNGMDVGQVRDITVENYVATVTMDVSKAARLPVGTGAELRQATPLGDVFVALLPPPGQSGATVADGATLTGPTSAAATVEDLLVSLGAVADSGSISSLQAILTELSGAVSASPDALSGAIQGLTTGISKFNANSTEVDESMRATRQLTGELAAGRAQIMASINKLGPALAAVSGQIDLILTTLNKTNSVTSATNDFLRTQQGDLSEMLTHLATLMSALRDAAPIFPTLSDNVAELTPKWAKSTSGSAAAVGAKLYYLTPGAGFDSASRLPELSDVDSGSQALQQTLTRLLARLTGTRGCCG